MSAEESKYDLTGLVIRTDEKYEENRAAIHDMELAQKDVANSLDRLEKRVDFGVAITGQKNSDELARQAVTIGEMKQTISILTNPETGVFKQIKDLADAVKLIYKGIVAIFFTLVISGLVVYGLKFFHFS